MRVRRRCENYSKHESRATNNILLLFDFYISLPSSLCFGALRLIELFRSVNPGANICIFNFVSENVVRM